MTFIRATREGSWDLHLACIRQFLPWMFAYDRHNYSRYLPVYWLQMLKLPKTHPKAHAYLSSGNFGVQRTVQQFSICPVDQTIEQTLNRDTKTKGGIVGFSIYKSAVQRWILNAHERAAISGLCRKLAGLTNDSQFLSKELGAVRKKRDESDVTKLQNTVKSWCNPFESSDQLNSLSSGVVADPSVTNDLLSAKDVGAKAADDFISERLKSSSKGFYDPISKNGLKTFSVKSKVSKTDRNAIIKADRHLFARLLVIAQSRQLNMRNVLQFELGPIPWSIATADGGLVKTNKAVLSNAIE